MDALDTPAIIADVERLERNVAAKAQRAARRHSPAAINSVGLEEVFRRAGQPPTGCCEGHRFILSGPSWRLLAHMWQVMYAQPETAYAVRCLPLIGRLELTLQLLNEWRDAESELPSNVIPFRRPPSSVPVRDVRFASNRSAGRGRPHNVGRTCPSCTAGSGSNGRACARKSGADAGGM